MAFDPISLNNVLLETHERLSEDRGGVDMSVYDLCDEIIEPAGRPANKRRIGGLVGVGAIPAHNGIDPYPTETLTEASHTEITYAEHALRLRIPWLRSEELGPGTWQWVASAMLREAWQTPTTATEVFLHTAFSANMQSGVPLISTAHPTKSGTRSTKLTAPLDATGLWAMQALRRGWTTYTDTADPQVGEGSILTVGPGLERDVEEAAGYQVSGSTGNAQQGTTGQRLGVSRVIVLNGWDDDDEDWLMSQPPPPRAADDPDSPNSNPIRVWWRKLPYILSVERDRTTGQYDLVCGYAVGWAFGPLPGHHFGSEVAS